jgi:hypothetical protein
MVLSPAAIVGTVARTKGECELEPGLRLWSYAIARFAKGPFVASNRNIRAVQF